MSRALRRPERRPLISLVDKAHRALQADMIRAAQASGQPEAKLAHNAVFATLQLEGSRAADMAARAGITRQSMGEVVRDLERLGLVETVPDPEDGRARIVRYTKAGLVSAQAGYDRIIELDEKIAKVLGPQAYEVLRNALEQIPALVAED